MAKQPKPKTCKLKTCGKQFVPERKGQKCCDIICATKQGKIEVAQQEKKEDNRIKREWYENNKTLSAWMEDLQDVVNAIIKLIDFKVPCIATNVLTGKRNSGHYYEKTAVPHIRFHLNNLHIQSEHSNRWKRGDLMRYREGLEYVYGLDYLKRVEALKELPAPEFTIDYVKEKIVIARKIVKELKKVERVYSTEERIELRNKYNEELGIYQN